VDEDAGGMIDTCSDIEGLIRIVRNSGWSRIGIDGVDGSGKTQVASVLSEALECPLLDVNDYLHQNQGGFVDFIDYPALGSAIRTIPKFILSGICLRAVLSNLGATLDGNIYIKRMHGGMWVDEGSCVFPEGIEAAVEALAMNRASTSAYFDEPAEHAGHAGNDNFSEFTEEVMRYHDAYQPHEEADLLFERGDEAG
jgi:hypothetical protein